MNYFASIFRNFVLIVSLSLFFSCGNDKNKSKDFSKTHIIPKTETFNVTPKENTSRISASEVSKLEKYNSETGTYIFSDDADEVENLEVGKVVLFETHSLRKITAIKKEGGKIIVESEYARLTDYFKEADISYSAPITWNDTDITNAKVTLGQPIATLAAPFLAIVDGEEDGLHVKIEREIRGWKVSFELTPEAGDKLKIKLKSEKERVCSIAAEGYISSFTSNANIQIQGGETQQFSYTNDGLEGEVELKFAAVGLGSDIAILEIPATIERTILVQGILPVTLRLKANLKIYPEVAAGSSSQASMKLTYNSNFGFSYGNGSMSATGGVSNDTAEQTGDSNTATAGIAGMGVGVEFPRFEVGILGNTVVPYLLLNTHASSYLSTGLLDNTPCHTATLKYEAHAGVTMNFLGITSINNDYKIFEQQKRWKAEGSHCGD
ncbi:MAG: hypothetical protein R2786_07870 [Flavobacteriaceae bacterium]